MFRLTGDQNYLEKAFIAADRNKDSQLATGIKDEESKKMGGVSDSLIQKEKNLQEESAFYQSLIREARQKEIPDLVKISKIQNDLTNSLVALEKTSKFIIENYPRYRQLKISEKEINIDTLKTMIGNKTLIEYAFAGDSLYTFILSGASLHLLSQPINDIENKILSYRKYLTDITDSATYTSIGIKRYINSSYKVYSLLFQHIKSYISGKEIILIPDGILSLIPFESLVTNDSIPAQNDYSLLNYLLYNYSINYTSSAKLYMMQQNMKSFRTDGVLAFAPKYGKVYIRDNTRKKGTDSLSFTLFDSETEARNVVNIFGGKVITGTNATKSYFKKYADDGKILHLSMHAIVNDAYPMNSYLAFKMGSSESENDYLNVYEIYNINLHTPLVVLSSCNTGGGKIIKGEGAISISRGFVYAGCPSLVTTLWSVADLNSSRLMTYFYKDLKDGERIDKSLQQAKIQYIENSDQINSHPFYWAGFIQSGKTGAISISSKKYHILLIGILIIVSLVYTTRKYLRYKKRGRL